MRFLVDGHNLIPKIPGLSLSDLEDEMQLIHLLQEYSRLSRNLVEVYFDQAAVGHVRSEQYGLVKAHFISPEKTADQAIIARLHRLGKAAAGWTVVSSDHQVQNEARSARAMVMTSENFAHQLFEKLESSQDQERREISMREEELSAWLRIFGNRDDKG